jgi:AcrR family transcriptional regulator
LTVRAVAERAGVSERTVYRYFPTERDLRDAVMERLIGEAEVNLDGLRIEGLQDLTARIFHYVARFPMQRREPQDETAAATGSRNREALLQAITPVTAGWPSSSRRTVAGMLDVLWSMVSYERLVMDWGLGTDDAIAGITWVMGLVEEAIRRGERPTRAPK